MWQVGERWGCCRMRSPGVGKVSAWSQLVGTVPSGDRLSGGLALYLRPCTEVLSKHSTSAAKSHEVLSECHPGCMSSDGPLMASIGQLEDQNSSWKQQLVTHRTSGTQQPCWCENQGDTERGRQLLPTAEWTLGNKKGGGRELRLCNLIVTIVHMQILNGQEETQL